MAALKNSFSYRYILVSHSVFNFQPPQDWH